jgi:hypothetical protein
MMDIHLCGYEGKALYIEKLGDQDSGLPHLSAQEEAIFNWRLPKIWEGLMLSMNADW